MTFQIPILLFLSNLQDELLGYPFLLYQLQDPITSYLITEQLSQLLKQKIIRLIGHHCGHGRVVLNSKQFTFDGFTKSAVKDTVAYNQGHKLISIINHYRDRHDFELQYLNLPCLRALGGFIKNSADPKQQMVSLFPLESLSVEIEDGFDFSKHIMNIHAHKWGPHKDYNEESTMSLPDTPPPSLASSSHHEPEPQTESTDQPKESLTVSFGGFGFRQIQATFSISTDGPSTNQIVTNQVLTDPITVVPSDTTIDNPPVANQTPMDANTVVPDTPLINGPVPSVKVEPMEEVIQPITNVAPEDDWGTIPEWDTASTTPNRNNQQSSRTGPYRPPSRRQYRGDWDPINGDRLYRTNCRRNRE